MDTLAHSPATATVSERSALAEWLQELPNTDEFREACAAMRDRKGSFMCSWEELATLSLLIKRLRPERVLEIGTFFAASARIMAEALAECGQSGTIDTIDPFGGHRVPSIISAWPANLQQVTNFQPMSSMDYFLDLETKGTPKGHKSPLQLVFVDGHHNLEYALFDLIRSADHLCPGGAIVVDNLEQDGPRQATVQFLRWNPAWLLHAEGVFYDADVCDAELAARMNPAHDWGVLISPEGIQICPTTRKFMSRKLSYKAVRGVRLNVRQLTCPGRLNVKFDYYATPYDFHLTGQGMVHKLARCSLPCSEFEPVMIPRFTDPVELTIGYSPYNLTCELELTFVPEDGESGYLLLDAEKPTELV
jgi:predicted O-methyltransferase YrrM